ncbi:unnamed protein product [Phaedon cochleariae]|uniref:DUF7869 domain-containing protein n=1 Tax=Phaedon cochleariae TaxID=80249 RepID=A0A9P0DKJ5_PHACE|nr:unnamed protein product [Phaedon cochleariae]
MPRGEHKDIVPKGELIVRMALELNEKSDSHADSHETHATVRCNYDVLKVTSNTNEQILEESIFATPIITDKTSMATESTQNVLKVNKLLISDDDVPISSGSMEDMAMYKSPLIRNAEDLLEFKQQLRPRYNNLVYAESESSGEKEPFSPDVSEYVPSENEGSPTRGNRQMIDVMHDIISYGNSDNVIEPSPSSNHRICEVNYNIRKENSDHVIEPSTSSKFDSTDKKNIGKQTRKMPKKSNPGRKRKRDPENWKINIKKRQKNLGQEFMCQRGKLMRKRVMKPGCEQICSRKCSDKLSVEMRTRIFTDFWALGDHNKQIQFVSRCVERLPRKQVLLSKIETSRRHWTYRYFFMIGAEKVQVCKKMFIDSLDITDKWVTTIYKKMDMHESNCVELDDRRGRHANRANKVREEIKETVRNHILQVPFVESHYVRARTKKQYFVETLTFPKLYKLYKEWLQENQYEPDLAATERQYREIFYNEYDIDFFNPKKDLCPTCDIFNRASTAEKGDLLEDYTSHIASKFVVRELKSQHKAIAQQSSSVVLACYDLEKILSTPMSEVSLFYYKRKLAVYNLTIFDVGKSEGFCYIWDETIAKKGANEVSSAVFMFIEMKVKDGFNNFIFYSDNCGGQNRNRIVFCMYAYAAAKFNIDITHIFLEVGHTQNEGDSMHALIERRKKNQTVYVPEQWVTIIRSAKVTGKPYGVKEMDQCKILDFKDLMNKQINFEWDIDGNKVKWNKVRCLKIEREKTNFIQLHYDFLSETSHYIDLDKKPVQRNCSTWKSKMTQIASRTATDVFPAYSGPIPISKAKYKDLNSLCTSKAIPDMYHNYYKNLQYNNVGGSAVQDDSE